MLRYHISTRHVWTTDIYTRSNSDTADADAESGGRRVVIGSEVGVVNMDGRLNLRLLYLLVEVVFSVRQIVGNAANVLLEVSTERVSVDEILEGVLADILLRQRITVGLDHESLGVAVVINIICER